MVSHSVVAHGPLIDKWHQESPHEQQQSLLLSRIIANIVCITHVPNAASLLTKSQEKLNEAVAMMNKNLQV